MSAKKLNIMITNKAKCLELIDGMTELEILIEDINTRNRRNTTNNRKHIKKSVFRKTRQY